MNEQVDQPEQESEGGWVLSMLATVVVVGALFVEAFLVVQLNNYRDMLHGESRGFAGMGIMMMLGASGFIVVPGTLIAISRLVLTMIRGRTFTAIPSVIFNLFAAFVMPAVVFTSLINADKPRAQTPPPVLTPAEERLAGAVKALDYEIENEKDCKGSPNFVAGCTDAIKKRLPR